VTTGQLGPVPARCPVTCCYEWLQIVKTQSLNRLWLISILALT
jgi:hypothetical protein